MGHQKKKTPIAYPPLYDYSIQNMIRYGTIRGLVLAILPTVLLVFLIVRAYRMASATTVTYNLSSLVLQTPGGALWCSPRI
jgi:uncharacterized membrane protein